MNENKRICRRGHDTLACGRSGNGQCRQCRRENQARYSNSLKGHLTEKRYQASAKFAAKIQRYRTDGRESATQKRYYEKNQVARGDYARRWKSLNPDKHRAHQRRCRAVRRLRDTSFRIACNLRARVYAVLRGLPRCGSSTQLLGCSIATFKRHIESLFQPGMSWDNWSRNGWHIDHVRPISRFDLQNLEGQRSAFHYSNTQPLWAEDNLQKGARL